MDKFAKWYNKEYLIFILSICITLYNTVNLQQNSVLLMSVPQALLVLFYIFNKQYHVAYFLHAFFFSACVSGGIFIEGGVNQFLYTQMSVYGPLTFHVIVLVTIWVAIQSKHIQISKDSLLFRVRKIILYLLISGCVIGLFGCLFINHYDWRYWGLRLLFVGEFFLFIDIFVHLYSEKYSKLFAIVTLCMMAASPVASFLSYSLFDARTYYNADSMALYNPILALSPCLIIALFQLNNPKLKIISLIGLIFYLLQTLILSRGSQYLDIFVALVLLGYLVYFKKSKNYQIKGLKFLLPLFLVVVMPLAISSITSGSEVSLMKFEQFTSLFSIFDFSNNHFSLQFDDVGRSPYIRLGELANIIHEGRQNIFFLIFGQGFGGFYTDSLNFFAGIDLSHGAFSNEIVAGGRFYNAHSAIPSVLQYNGLIGLFLMLKIAITYLRRVDKSFLVFAAFVLFVQSFYFDMIGCMTFMMALFGAEYLINENPQKGRFFKKLINH